MLKRIKTKPAIKDIKILDKSADVSHRMKNAYIRTKNQTEQTEHNNDENYINSAGNNVLESTQTAVRKTGRAVANYSKRAFDKVKQSIKRSISRPGARQMAKNSSTFRSGVKAAARPSDTFSKTGRTIKQSAETGGKTVKKAAKGTIKTPQKSVKTVERTAKAAIKTSQVAAKTTVKSAQATKRSVQAARVAARAAIASVQAAMKAITVMVKATVAAVKGIIALIAAGGWIAVIVILVICLAGSLISSVYGIFLSNESSGRNAPIMTEVVGRLNEEFSAEIQRIQDDNPHDTLELSGSGTVNNCPEVLAVYAVKVSANPENGMEVATLGGTKTAILRGVFRDMNSIDYWLETIEHDETVTTTDKDGNEVEKNITVIETILNINVTSKSYPDMIELYGFNVQQVNMLNELMKDENRQLFMQLTGG